MLLVCGNQKPKQMNQHNQTVTKSQIQRQQRSGNQRGEGCGDKRTR